jgi:hypothetical protein
MLTSTFLSAVLAVAAALDPATADFFIAPDGNDANPGTVEAPFATLGKAQEAVRTLVAAGLTKEVAVCLRAGTYQLPGPLVFGIQDSGTPEHSITYAAYPHEKVLISGGRTITGWQKGDGGRWMTELPDVKAGAWHFRQLFVDGNRLPRGRFPNAPDLLRVESVSGDVKVITLDQDPGTGDLAGHDAELVMYQNWSISRTAIVSSEGKTVNLANPMGWIGHGSATTASPHKPTIIENALSFVDQPGEWYLDRAAGILTYMAAEGEDPNQRRFVAPVSEQLVVVAGQPGEPVRNLHFSGLSFQHTAWPLPSFGYQGIQAGHHGTTMTEPSHVLPLAIEFTYAEACSLVDCRIAHTGACGIGFGQQCRENRVQGCELDDIGGNGIMTGWRGKAKITGMDKAGDHYLAGDWVEPADVPAGNQVVANSLRRCGAVNHGCVGIYDAFCADTRIAHNVVTDMPYTGISIGFRWDTSSTSQRATIVEYNHVYDTMKMLADGGCIYTLGYQPGTILRGNVLHDVHRSAFAHGGAPNNGIFFDQGSKGYHVVGNTIYNTSGKPIRFNQTNAGNLTWENNSFGVGPEVSFAP